MLVGVYQKAMQEEASKVLQSLEASTEELRQEATHAKSFVEQAKEQAQRSLHDEEESLQEVLSRSSSLKQRVTQKVGISNTPNRIVLQLIISVRLVSTCFIGSRGARSRSRAR